MDNKKQEIQQDTNTAKIKISFECAFDDMDIREELNDMLKIKDYKASIHDILDELRQLWKYADLDDKTYDTIDKLRDRVYDILTSHEISTD